MAISTMYCKNLNTVVPRGCVAYMCHQYNCPQRLRGVYVSSIWLSQETTRLICVINIIVSRGCEAHMYHQYSCPQRLRGVYVSLTYIRLAASGNNCIDDIYTPRSLWGQLYWWHIYASQPLETKAARRIYVINTVGFSILAVN
jgi:hypothetical protein